MTASDEPLQISEPSLDVIQGFLRASQEASRIGRLSLDPGHLDLEQIQRYCSGVVGLQELGPFLLDRRQALGLPLYLGSRTGLDRLHLLSD